MRPTFPLVLTLCYASALAQPLPAQTPLHKLPAARMDQQLANPMRSMEIYRAGLTGTVAFANSRGDLFRASSERKRVWSDEEKAVVRQL
ncbi:MAG: hypothetical protein JNJ55_08390 [Betaproteobacteria bacterium]|nr:hypothetical protein [Betaproteobacteria bacterium]